MVELAKSQIDILIAAIVNQLETVSRACGDLCCRAGVGS